ncbi:LysR substrate-binding domain-containing protein [Sciscionella sediminilitoris]|uniref:LysR substrate-binding domain-containing protein n=1 Tax=Sciscionella sediminilitoris TaxID=1445613 RepID=UPI00055DC6CD|nr:LysR substrate-binding domain-containing protein [Sciscionella sp. SE31]
MFPPDQVRTFLAVAQSLSFTQAATTLGLRQPTVSQHIRKLEETVGRPLLVRDTRSVTLTVDGEAMVGFARSILAAHAQAADYFTGAGVRGRLRFGVTDDLALTQVPRILRDFRHLNPGLTLDLTVSQGIQLQRRVESGHVDVAFLKTPPGDGRGRLVRRDRQVWAAVEGSNLGWHDERPVPLIVYPAPSPSRELAVQKLEQAGVRYRLACTARGHNAVLAATRAGLGVSIFPRSLLPTDLVEVPASTGLPELPELDLVLLTNPHAPAEPVEALTTTILAHTNRIRPIHDTRQRTGAPAAGKE